MSINLIDLMKDQLTGAIAGQIGNKLGVDKNAAESGIGAILPTILGGLMKQSSTPAGAESLNNTLDQADFDGGLLDKLPDLLGGGGGNDQGGMLSGMGDTLLRSLFGDKVASIVGLISKFTGMDSGKSGSLMALLAPLVMSFLGKQKRSMGLDANGLAGLLSSQKDAVASSLPPGLAGTMGLGELGITDSPAAAAPSHSHSTSQGGGGLGKLLIPLVIIAALGFLAYKFLGGAGDAINDGVDAVKNAEVGLPEVPTVDSMTGQLSGVFDNYKETLSGVTDEASASAALPQLEEYNEKLGGMSDLLGKLPEGARGAVGDQVKSMLGPIQGIIDKLYAIPGVKSILDPVLSSMVEKAKALIPGA
ncbi:DUF937 domain-containing protein [Planctomycetes bacterium K23_9]|uniref:DUF937 domain-containing protein n=1 Tax=Stieleria marina TaxID=1930275 RepID=A0A517NMZ6_9BACT|nr:hypothetical protein K239x_04360 [Planctomycetes bacterium K23_9]